MYEDALVTAWMIGLIPMVRVAVDVAVVQTPLWGLHTPRTTEPPEPEKGRYGSALEGTVIVSAMLVELTTLDTTLESATMAPLVTIPAFVATVGSLLTMNPEPLRTTVKLPVLAVGMDDGDTLLMAAPGDLTFTVMLTVTAEPPEGVMITAPVRAAPGAAAPKTDCRKVTCTGLPKL